MHFWQWWMCVCERENESEWGSQWVWRERWCVTRESVFYDGVKRAYGGAMYTLESHTATVHRGSLILGNADTGTFVPLCYWENLIKYFHDQAFLTPNPTSHKLNILGFIWFCWLMSLFNKESIQAFFPIGWRCLIHFYKNNNLILI